MSVRFLGGGAFLPLPPLPHYLWAPQKGSSWIELKLGRIRKPRNYSHRKKFRIFFQVFDDNLNHSKLASTILVYLKSRHVCLYLNSISKTLVRSLGTTKPFNVKQKFDNSSLKHCRKIGCWGSYQKCCRTNFRFQKIRQNIFLPNGL